MGTEGLYEFDAMVGKFEEHHVNFIFDNNTGETTIKVDDIEIFESRPGRSHIDKKHSSHNNKHFQWFYSFIIGTQETHIIEVHLRKHNHNIRKNGNGIDLNLLVDSVMIDHIGKKLDPQKSTTKGDVILINMSRDHFHILSEVEKKLYARDIMKDPNWEENWVYIH